MQILAATDFSIRSSRALRQALDCWHSAASRICMSCTSSTMTNLVRLEGREAERLLLEQMGAMAELQGVRCHPTVTTGAPLTGILRTAAQL